MMGLQGFINGMLAEPWENQETQQDRVEIVSDAGIPEARRYLTADVQAAAPFLWWVCREWSKGNSRLVGAGHADDFAALRRIQLQYNVHDMDVGVDSGYNTQAVYDACAEFSQSSASPINYPCGLRYPPEGGLRKPMLIGWLPMKGRETGARFTSKTGSIHPFGITTSTSMRTDAVQPLLVFDTEHMREVLQRLRKGTETHQWSVCSLPAPLDAEGAFASDSDTYWKHLDSHILRPTANRSGRIKHLWYKRNTRWPDHLHDCEIMQLAMVMLWGDLTSSTSENSNG